MPTCALKRNVPTSFQWFLASLFKASIVDKEFLKLLSTKFMCKATAFQQEIKLFFLENNSIT
jgi:hypothetical protein